MFPFSSSVSFSLISIVSVLDGIGSKRLVISSSKEVVGMVGSITSKEYQTSVAINKTFDYKVSIQSFLYDDSKYAIIKGKIYKIERTYISGMFIELYMSLSDITLEELSNE